jgi:hypothetical protein
MYLGIAWLTVLVYHPRPAGVIVGVYEDVEGRLLSSGSRGAHLYFPVHLD